jgi:tRNA 2-selenouridine synthase
MPEQLDVAEFLQAARDLPVFDARTPAEFAHSHIPGAHNLPLFLDEHRHQVGTTYKQQGRQEAILEGLDLVGPRMRELVEAVIAVAGPPQECDHPILVHCWRGGMRSGSLAWLLEFYGYEVVTLKGGYKAFRNWVLATFERPLKLLVLGGYTGSGKTLTLFELERAGEQIIDLEGCANHKGSSFGALGLPPQPGTAHFENRLAMAISLLDPERRIFLEDESRMVGTCRIPEEFWKQMKDAHVLALMVPLEVRVERLVDAYGEASADELVTCFERIEKRLGSRDAKQAVEAVKQGDLREAAAIGLGYYDRAYEYGLQKRPEAQVTRIEVDAQPPEELARIAIDAANTSK